MIIWVESLILPENISFDMKKINLLFFLLLVAGVAFQSCSKKYKTYAERLEDEKNAIDRFLDEKNINVISQNDFLIDSITDLSKNQYVRFNNGIYMQIIDKGEGKKAENGDQILIRFEQIPLLDDTVSLNSFLYPNVDEIRYQKTTSSTSATFISEDGNWGAFVQAYYSSSTGIPTPPQGWLVPLDYIKLSRNTSKLARVKLIVPFNQGHAVAQQYFIPYFYELTYQLSR